MNDARANRQKLTRNLPFSVSRRCRSTALWVALRSAVFARRLGLRFMPPRPRLGASAAAEGLIADAGGVSGELLLLLGDVRPSGPTPVPTLVLFVLFVPLVPLAAMAAAAVLVVLVLWLLLAVFRLFALVPSTSSPVAERGVAGGAADAAAAVAAGEEEGGVWGRLMERTDMEGRCGRGRVEEWSVYRSGLGSTR